MGRGGKTRVRRIGGAVLVLLALVAWWIAWHGPQGTPVPGGAGHAVPPPPPVIRPVPIPAGSTSIGDVPGEATAPDHLLVRVEGSDGAPLADAHVVVAPARERRGGGGAAERSWSGTTGADGAVRIGLPERVRAQSLRARASHPSHAAAETECVTGEVTLRLVAGAVLEGTVSDVARRARVEGVRLRLVRHVQGPVLSETETGADGRYTLPPVPPGFYVLQVNPPQHLDLRLPGMELVVGRQVRDVVVAAGLRLAGVVRFEDGTPLDEGTVSDLAIIGRREAPIGPDGRFVLQGLTRIPGWFLIRSPRARRGPVQPAVPPSIDPVTGVQQRDVELVAVGGAACRGRVVDPDGAPVPGARVVIGWGDILGNVHTEDRREHPAGVPHFDETVTDAEGRFVLVSLSPGEILILHPDFAPFVGETKRSAWDRELEFRLAAESRLVLAVRDPDGNPDVHARVRTWLRTRVIDIPRHMDPRLGWSGGDPRGAVHGPAVTDGDGRAVVDGLCEGVWQLKVLSADGERWAERLVEVAPGEEGAVEIVTEPAPAVLGVVRDRAGKPLDGVRVILMQERALNRDMVTGEDGAFRFPQADLVFGADTYRVLVHSVRPDRMVRSEHSDWVDIRADVPTDLVVTVVDIGRAVAVEVIDSLTAEPLPWGDWKVRVPLGDDVSTNLTGSFAAGRFETRVPTAGPGVALTVSAPGHQQVVVRDLPDGGTLHVELPPIARESVALLRVRAPEGFRLFSASVHDAETGERIGYHFADGPVVTTTYRRSGRVLVTAQSGGSCVEAPAEVELVQGGEVDVVVPLRRGGGKITVQGAPRTEVTVRDPWNLTFTAWIGPDGETTLSGLAPGTYSLTSADRSPVEAAVTDGETVTVDLFR